MVAGTGGGEGQSEDGITKVGGRAGAAQVLARLHLVSTVRTTSPRAQLPTDRRLTKTVERNMLLAQNLNAQAGLVSSACPSSLRQASARPEDLVRIYDILLQVCTVGRFERRLTACRTWLI